ncbi:MAG: T9SS type A sorting domain-containing protein [Candidatus Marinimicrobia bacterium]|nr:T9SS type A sorting domain-containing protein [Candidatus Neomarinimicrobiota bacterium]
MAIKFQKSYKVLALHQKPTIQTGLTLTILILLGFSLSVFGKNLNDPFLNFTLNTNETPLLLFPLDTNFAEDSRLNLSHEIILDAVYDPDHDDSLLTISITTDSGLVFYWFDQTSGTHKFWANKDIDSCGYFHIRIQDPLDSVFIASFIVDIIPVNDAPVLAEIPDTSAIQDTTFFLPLNSYWSDVDNELSEVTWSVNALYSDVSITGTNDGLVCVPPSGFTGWDTLFLALTDFEGLTDRDTFRVFFQDAFPPGFTIGIFQNPVASEHLDLYFFPNESIDSIFSTTINGDSAVTELLTGITPSPFYTHYRLQDGGNHLLRIIASDTSGNIGMTEYDFSSSFISKMNGGIIYSPDSVAQLILTSESIISDKYFLCLPYYGNSQTGGKYSDLIPPKKANNVDEHHYTFVSPNAHLLKKCKIIFNQNNGGQQPGIFEWQQANWTYIKTYSNVNNTQYWAYVDKLGKYALKPNAPEIAEMLPNIFSLAQNYPNPFNSETVISFYLPDLQGTSIETATQIIVNDILGRKVATVIDQSLAPGQYSVQWNGSRLASGLYYYTLRYGQFNKTKKMVLVK